MRGAVLALLTFMPGTLLHAQTDPTLGMEALRIRERIEVDGSLDEPAWQAARPVASFTQREPAVGRPATQRTQVAVLYDADALYIGFWGYDANPDAIRADEMARDFNYGAEDDFAVVLDPFDDDRNGYLFVTNANGAQADALISEGSQNKDWDGVWAVRSRRTHEGWFAELRIPFSTLRVPSGGSRPWGINFERNIRTRREQVLWRGWSRDSRLEILSQAGTLTGIHDLARARATEARPFALGGAHWSRGTARQTTHSAGLDVSFLPLPSWKVNVTVRPDFAQVESDQQQVNLSRFSIFYPEKRTFFLEGGEFFAFDLGSDSQPFYSRRIGLAADRTEVPILGGARVLGKSGGTTLGAMALRTEANGNEAAAEYGILRWKRDILGQSSVGLIAVGKHEPERTAATYGVDARYATSTLFGEREFRAGFAMAQTYVSDAPARFGLAQRVFVNYPNDLVDFSASWARTDSTFDPRVGYLRRSNFQRISSEFSISPRPAFLPFIRQLEVKPWEATWYLDDRTRAFQSFSSEFRPLGATFQSGESFELNFQRRGDRPEQPFELFEGVEVPAGTYWYNKYEVQIESYRARRFSGNLEFNTGGFYGGRRQESTIEGRWKANKHASLSGGYVNNRITFQDRVYLVNEASLRLDFAVSPTLFGAMAAQWNDEDDLTIVNFRLHWIPAPGSDVFLVINQQGDTAETFWRPGATTAVSKVVWRIAF